MIPQGTPAAVPDLLPVPVKVRPVESGPAPAPRATWIQTRALLSAIFLILAVAAGLWVLYKLADVILLVVLATFFAYLIAPLVDLMERAVTQRIPGRRIPRAVSIGLVYLLLFGSLGTIGAFLAPRLGMQIRAFAQQAPSYVSNAKTWLQTSRFGHPDFLPQPIHDAVQQAAAQSTEAIGTSLSYGLARLLAFLAFLPWLVLIPILAFFLLKDAEFFLHTALLALPVGHLRGSGADLFEAINQTLVAYIRAALLGCLWIGLACTVAFLIIGVPYALLLGVLAGFLEFIPLVGPLVVAVSAALVTGFHSSGQAIAVLVFLGTLRILQDYVIFPRLIGLGIHMHPLAVILAVLCGAELGGIAGIFLAIPVVAVLSVVLRHWLEYRRGPAPDVTLRR